MTKPYRDPLPRWLIVPAGAGVLLLWLPLIGLLGKIEWASLPGQLGSESSLTALRLSLVTASVSTIIAVALGVPLAVWFAHARARWVRVVRIGVLLPVVLPPVVAGLALLYTFGRTGPIGGALEDLGIRLAFTTTAVVLAQTVVALPFLVLSVEGAAVAVGHRYAAPAASLGASPSRVWWTVTLPLLRPALLTGAVLAFARALGEFGATATFAGSLEGTTRTLPLEIYLQREADPQAAVALSMLLVVVAVVVLGFGIARRPASMAG